MTAREELAALRGKLATMPECPLRALTAPERARLATLSARLDPKPTTATLDRTLTR